MKYRDLYKKIEQMTEQQKDMDVTLLDSNDDEFCALTELRFSKDSDVLDKDHPYFFGFGDPTREYTVNVTRTAFRTTDIKVKAESEEEASRLALEAAHDVEFPNEHDAQYDVEYVD
ncbi:MAG: hypothetical protein ACTSWQ_03965 [Candidatus Thorarchaeota archaeon]